MVKKFYVLVACAAVALFCLPVLNADDKPAETKAKVVCPVSGKDVSADHTVEYKGGKVSFCCPNCLAAFKKDTKKFATKANLQLVASGQFVQTKCPLAGKKFDAEKSTKVAGLEIGFCCGGCLGKVKKAEGDDQLALVFSEDPFKKGFEKKKEKKDESKLINRED